MYLSELNKVNSACINFCHVLITYPEMSGTKIYEIVFLVFFCLTSQGSVAATAVANYCSLVV